jgi:hypothetical protein
MTQSFGYMIQEKISGGVYFCCSTWFSSFDFPKQHEKVMKGLLIGPFYAIVVVHETHDCVSNRQLRILASDKVQIRPYLACTSIVPKAASLPDAVLPGLKVQSEAKAWTTDRHFFYFETKRSILFF